MKTLKSKLTPLILFLLGIGIGAIAAFTTNYLFIPAVLSFIGAGYWMISYHLFIWPFND